MHMINICPRADLRHLGGTVELRNKKLRERKWEQSVGQLAHQGHTWPRMELRCVSTGCSALDCCWPSKPLPLLPVRGQQHFFLHFLLTRFVANLMMAEMTTIRSLVVISRRPQSLAAANGVTYAFRPESDLTLRFSAESTNAEGSGSGSPPPRSTSLTSAGVSTSRGQRRKHRTTPTSTP